MSAKSRLPSLVALVAVAVLAACATPPPASDPEALADFRQTNDPLEPTNRAFYAVNDVIDTYALKPAAQAYRFVTPKAVRDGVHNVLYNLATPVLLTNDMLQGKPRRAGDTTMRFLINTTVGGAGIFDVASDWGYPGHDNDMGITLGLWGVPEGPYLFLPVLGPNSPRDVGGFVGDLAADPFNWVGQGATVTALLWGRVAIAAIDTRERLLDTIDSIKKTALDPYATFRSLYRQRRAAQIEEVRNDTRATIPVWFSQATAGNPQ